MPRRRQSTATDADLSAFLASHPDKFQEPRRVAFEQVYLDAQKRGHTAHADAAALLASLKKDAAIALGAGDSTQLPTSMTLTDSRASRISSGMPLPQRSWLCSRVTGRGPSNPASVFICEVTSQEAGRLPALAEIRQQVERGMAERRSERVGTPKTGRTPKAL